MEYHKPEFFITMTCNPNWEEVKKELLPDQNPEDRPNIVVAVFKQKLDALMNDLIKGGNNTCCSQGVDAGVGECSQDEFDSSTLWYCQPNSSMHACGSQQPIFIKEIQMPHQCRKINLTSKFQISL